MNSLQQRCLLHTCLPLMNKEKSSDKKDINKSDGSDEQPHMRIEPKATTEEKRMYEKNDCKCIVTFSVHAIFCINYFVSFS